MKKLLLSIILLTGCSNPAFDEVAIRQNLIKEFKSTDIANVPDKKYIYIVRTPDGAIWIAKAMSGSTADITSRSIIFNPLK